MDMTILTKLSPPERSFDSHEYHIYLKLRLCEILKYTSWLELRLLLPSSGRDAEYNLKVDKGRSCIADGAHEIYITAVYARKVRNKAKDCVRLDDG